MLASLGLRLGCREIVILCYPTEVGKWQAMQPQRLEGEKHVPLFTSSMVGASDAPSFKAYDDCSSCSKLKVLSGSREGILQWWTDVGMLRWISILTGSYSSTIRTK